MKLAALSFQSTPSYTQLVSSANAIGHEVEEVLFPDDGTGQMRAWGLVERVLNDADAILLPSSLVFRSGKSEWQDLLHQRINNGLRVMFSTWANDLEVQNRFLAFYGLAATNVRLHSSTPVVQVRRSTHTYRDPLLLAGVGNIEISGAVLVVTRADALPVLLATGDELPVDRSSDKVVAWVGKDRPLMGVWHGDAGGAVLLVGGSVLADPRTSMSGVEHRGIAANERLGKNILRFLLPQAGRLVRDELGPEQLVARAERNLADFVLGALAKESPKWWFEYIPERVRRTAADRHEQEKGRFPKHAQLDLLDLREILRSNFKHFEPLLKQVGWTGGKDAATAWLITFNEHRRLVAHPLKAHVSGHVFSSEDMTFLKEVDRRVSDLLRFATKEPLP